MNLLTWTMVSSSHGSIAVGITCMCLRGSVDCARPLVTVAKWRPNIWPSKEEIATPAVWIRLLGLPLALLMNRFY